MIERFKIFLSCSVSTNLGVKVGFYDGLLDVVTQQCGYKSTDPLTCFVCSCL